MAIVLRPPHLDDAEALGGVHVRAWQVAYRDGLMPDDYLDSLSVGDRAEMWRRGLSADPAPRSHRLVAASERAVVGFAIVGPARHDDTLGELYAINVDPDHWGQGAGRALIDRALQLLAGEGFARAVLWVHPGNARARRFYAASGWADDGVERVEDVLGVEVPEVRYSIDLVERLRES